MIDFLINKTPLFFLFQSFWRDEAFTALLSRRPLLEIISLTARDFTPPAYYLLVHMWMVLFGSSEVAIRLFSTAWFVILLCGVHLLFKDVFAFTKKELRWYMGLVLVNPMMWYYAFEGRAYMMLAAIAVWSWYFLAKGQFTSYTKIAILGLYTHYFFLFNLVSQAIYTLTYRVHKQTSPITTLKPMIVAGIWFFPWVIYLALSHNAAGESFWINAPTIKTLLYLPAILFTGHESTFGFPAGFSLRIYTILLIAVMGISIFYKNRHSEDRKHYVYMSVLWTLVPCVLAFVVSYWKPLFLPRYLIFCTVGYLVLLSLFLSKIRSQGVRIVLIITLYLISFHYMALLLNYRQKEHIRQTVASIKSQANNTDLIYVDSVLNFHTAQYYFDPDRVYIVGESYKSIPSYVGKVLITPDRIATYYPNFPQKAFVIHGDMSYDIQSVY